LVLLGFLPVLQPLAQVSTLVRFPSASRAAHPQAVSHRHCSASFLGLGQLFLPPSLTTGTPSKFFFSPSRFFSPPQLRVVHRVNLSSARRAVPPVLHLTKHVLLILIYTSGLAKSALRCWLHLCLGSILTPHLDFRSTAHSRSSFARRELVTVERPGSLIC
jgi:hypothetical protein